MRLISKTYDEGVFVRNEVSEPSVARLSNSDAISVNYLQHLIINATDDTPESPYIIRSVVDLHYLGADTDNALVWESNQNFFPL